MEWVIASKLGPFGEEQVVVGRRVGTLLHDPGHWIKGYSSS